MSLQLTFHDSKKSKNRISAFPRFGVTVDFAGKQFTFRSVSLLEALLAASKEKPKSTKDLLLKAMKILGKNMTEVQLRNLSKGDLAAMQMSVGTIKKSSKKVANTSAKKKSKISGRRK